MTPLVQAFENLFKIEKNQHPKLMKEFLGSRVSLETMVILEELVSYEKSWDKQLEDDIIWPELKKLMNDYKRFLTIDREQYKIKLLNLIEESS